MPKTCLSVSCVAYARIQQRAASSSCGMQSLCAEGIGQSGGRKQFDVLKRVVEYGLVTKDVGIIYSKGLDKHGVNVIHAYADASHSVPRNQGCTVIMMNDAAVSMSSKKHTVTAASTCHGELIEFSTACNKVSGMRNIISKIGMHDDVNWG